MVDGVMKRDPIEERIHALIESDLEKVADLQTRGILYRDRADGRYWEMTLPHSEMHGGGPARLAVISQADAEREYSPARLAAADVRPAPDYTLRFEITPDAILDLLRLRLSPIYPLINLAVGMMLVAALSMVGIGVAIESVRGIWVLAILIALMAGLLLAMQRNRSLLRWQVGRSRQGVFGAAELTSTADGLRMTTPAAVVGVSWSQLTGVRADGRTVAFERQRRLSAWVPYAAFASKEERDDFIQYARDEIASASSVR
jgi:hypothetical protein